MNPRTFHIIIRRSFGGYAGDSISIYLHKESWDEALYWVTEVFPGVDTGPTIRRRNSKPGDVPKIGNSDPVWIQDVDYFSTKVTVKGKTTSAKVPEGTWRCDSKRVKQDLERAVEFLSHNLTSSRRGFAELKHLYETGRTSEGAYDRLLKTKQFVERAEIWKQNLQNQLKSLGFDKELEMPEKRKR